MTSYEIPDGPKMLRETLCVAQTRIGNSDLDTRRQREHIERLQRLIDACDRHRPLGPDSKHGDRHTLTCGCEQDTVAPARTRRRAEMADKTPFATDDTITLPIPTDLAAKFVLEESDTLAKSRGYALLQFGTTDLGYWRIEAVASQANDGIPRMIATLRRVLP